MKLVSFWFLFPGSDHAERTGCTEPSAHRTSRYTERGLGGRTGWQEAAPRPGSPVPQADVWREAQAVLSQGLQLAQGSAGQPATSTGGAGLVAQACGELNPGLAQRPGWGVLRHGTVREASTLAMTRPWI